MLLRFSAFVIAASMGATAVQAQLMSERVQGAIRYCRYLPSGLGSSGQAATVTGADLEARLRDETARGNPLRESEEREIAIDSSRTCPNSYPDRPETRTIVPTFATLESQRRVNGELLCIYTYLGQRYAVSLGSRSLCPYTPVGIAY